MGWESLNIGWRSAALIGLSGPILLAALFIVARGAERRASVLLSAMLLLWGWQTVPFIIGFAGAYSAFPWLNFAPFSTELWFGPLFYLHACALARSTPHPQRWWLLAPGLIQTAYYTTCFVFLGSVANKSAFAAAVHQPFIAPVEKALALTLGVGGVVLAWRETRAYRHWLDRSHSAADRFDPLWLRRVVTAMAGLVALWVGVELWEVIGGPLAYVELFWFQLAVGAVLLWLSFEALTRVDLVFPKIANDVVEPSPSPVAPLDPGDIAERIRDAGWHRDATISVAKLAQHLATNSSYVSRSINQGAGMNFNQFINRIRIDEVCERLRDPHSDDSILAIALAAGFASKATFNRVFRHQVGSTPSRWMAANRASRIE